MTGILYPTDDESILSIKQWDNIIAGMTTRKGGISEPPYSSLNVGFHVGDRASDVLANRSIVAEKLSIPLHRWVSGDQPHGKEIYKVQRGDAGKGSQTNEDAIAGVDGLYTEERGVLLVSLYADCVPLYFFAKQRQMIGIAHAGWKGTVANIAGNMIKMWSTEGIEAEAIQVVIGPSIGACCYEVNHIVMNEVDKLHLGEKVSQENRAGNHMLDLRLINKLLLIEAGVKAELISMSSFCTSCSQPTFFSHRKEKEHTGRMMAYIGLQQNN